MVIIMVLIISFKLSSFSSIFVFYYNVFSYNDYLFIPDILKESAPPLVYCYNFWGSNLFDCYIADKFLLEIFNNVKKSKGIVIIVRELVLLSRSSSISFKNLYTIC